MSNKQPIIGLGFKTPSSKEFSNEKPIFTKRQRIITMARKYNGPLHGYLEIRKQNYLLVENLKEKEIEFENIAQMPNRCIVNLRTPESILHNFLYSRQVSVKDLARHISIREREVYRFFDSKRSIQKDNYIIAGRIGDALGTPPKLWLDVQYYLRLKTYLEKRPYMAKYFDLNTIREKISMTNMKLTGNISSPPPGQILDELYLKPSRIVREYWAHYFCRDRHVLVKIINGKLKMDFDFIALIVKAFDVRASDWIDLQNEYLVGKYVRMKLENNRTKPIFLIRSNHFQIASHMHPGKILLKLFVIPRNLTLREVAEHLGISCLTLKTFTEGNIKVNPKLAIKFGHAFNTTPMYWLDLQMDFDLLVQRQAYWH